jgi:hypothetical protein
MAPTQSYAAIGENSPLRVDCLVADAPCLPLANRMVVAFHRDEVITYFYLIRAHRLHGETGARRWRNER